MSDVEQRQIIQIMPGDDYYLVFPAGAEMLSEQNRHFDKRIVWRVAAWALYPGNQVRALVAVEGGKLVHPPEGFHHTLHRSQLSEHDYQLATGGQYTGRTPK